VHLYNAGTATCPTCLREGVAGPTRSWARRNLETVPAEALTASPAPLPRVSVIRVFADAKVTVATLNGSYPVLVVLRTSKEDQRRTTDFLSGWALGSGGDVDRIGPNTLLVRPPNCPPVQLAKSGFVSAVEEVFAGDEPRPLSRDEEERLILQAVAGSVNARRRVIDAYAELATLFALKIRPRSVSEARAVRVAQQELDRLVTFPSKGPLLASLVEGIANILVR